MREKFGTSLHEDGVDDYFIVVAAGSVSEDTVRNFDNWFVFPASIKSFVLEKGKKKGVVSSRMGEIPHFPPLARG